MTIQLDHEIDRTGELALLDLNDKLAQLTQRQDILQDKLNAFDRQCILELAGIGAVAAVILILCLVV